MHAAPAILEAKRATAKAKVVDISEELRKAEEKIKDTNAGSLETCARSLAGTARSMGVDVIEG